MSAPVPRNPTPVPPATAAARGTVVFTLRPHRDAAALLRLLRDSDVPASNLALHRRQHLPPLLPDPASSDAWVFTSPAAVASLAHALARQGRVADLSALLANVPVYAPGPGTARALQARGVDTVQVPAQRHDSEGLLALPGLAAPRGLHITLVGAPGGRDRLRVELAARGADVRELHTYRRRRLRLSGRRKARLLACPRPLLLVSAGGSLDALLDALTAGERDRLRARARLVVASDRLAALAREAGFTRIDVATSALAQALFEAAIAVLQRDDHASTAGDSVSMRG